jgi:tRNA dimethylallyltransferase
MSESLHKPLLILTGPTGAGKTDLSYALGQKRAIQIINIDRGQWYTPLTIGTAKPDWRNSNYKHWLFDICDTPTLLSVVEYRKKVLDAIERIEEEGALPVLVGGSLFYIESLLYPPQPVLSTSTYKRHAGSWQELARIDPKRAAAIHPNDTYRIERALAIWYESGRLPSSLEPLFSPFRKTVVAYLSPERSLLYERINKRVQIMIDRGWLDEAYSLLNTPWEEFVQKYSIIGYAALINYIRQGYRQNEKDGMLEHIGAQTRDYAKRQECFFKRLERKIQQENSPMATTVRIAPGNDNTTTLLSLCSL